MHVVLFIDRLILWLSLKNAFIRSLEGYNPSGPTIYAVGRVREIITMELNSLDNLTMQPRAIAIPAGGTKYISLLEGPPDSISIRSGYVELLPGESVGLHSTEDYEEMIVPLSGRGQLTSPGLDPLPITINFILYNPPHTPHDVVNSGDVPLRYIYIVTKK